MLKTKRMYWLLLLTWRKSFVLTVKYHHSIIVSTWSSIISLWKILCVWRQCATCGMKGKQKRYHVKLPQPWNNVLIKQWKRKRTFCISSLTDVEVRIITEWSSLLSTRSLLRTQLKNWVWIILSVVIHKMKMTMAIQLLKQLHGNTQSIL